MDPRNASGMIPDATSRALAATSRGPLARKARESVVAGRTYADAASRSQEFIDRGYAIAWRPLLRRASGPDDILQARDEAIGALKALGSLTSSSKPGWEPDLTLDIAHFGVMAVDIMPGLLLTALREVGQAARNAGVTITLTVEHPGLLEAANVVCHELRQDFPQVGILVPTRLREMPDDIFEGVKPGQRFRLTDVRLPAELGTTSRREAGRSYVEAAKLLLQQGAQVTVLTESALLLDITESLADSSEAEELTEAFTVMGMMTARQKAWAQSGRRLRVQVPYGTVTDEYVHMALANNPSLVLPSALRKRS